MTGIFVKVDKDEIKNIVGEMLEANTSVIELASSTSQLSKIRKEKLKLQRDFLMKIEELELEINKINSFMPSLEIKTGRKIKPKTGRKTKYESELEEIHKRLEELRQR